MIGLDVYRLVIFTLYYEPTPPPLKVLANSIYTPVSRIFTTIKSVCI